VGNGLRAPSAGFSQGWGFLVLDTPTDMARFGEAVRPPDHPEDWFAANVDAPLLIIPHSNKDAYLDRNAQPDKGFSDRPDAWWPELGIAVEVDSREWHLSPEDHANTLARGRRMAKHQVVVLRFTPRQIRTQPAEVVKDIKAALEGAQDRPPLKLKTIPAGDSGNGAAA